MMKNCNSIDRDKTVFSYDEIESSQFYADYGYGREMDLDVVESDLIEIEENISFLEEGSTSKFLNILLAITIVLFFFSAIFGQQIANFIIL